MRILVAIAVQVLAVRYATDEEAAGFLHLEILFSLLHGSWGREAPEIVHHALRCAGVPLILFPDA
ncbi:hypothetical protein JQ595_23335 [Bradyrhizobium japonicum]|nr:hypothetical protein [Bradyrhizobium japonicum]